MTEGLRARVDYPMKSTFPHVFDDSCFCLYGNDIGACISGLPSSICGSVHSGSQFIMTYRIAGNLGGVLKNFFRGPVSGTKVKTHDNFNLCTTYKCEVFDSRN